MQDSALQPGFQPDGSRYSLYDPYALDRADYDLWNDRMFLHLDHRGCGRGAYLQPNPLSYAGEGRWFYLRDKVSGKVWSVPFGPVYAKPDAYKFTVSRDTLEWRVLKDGIEVRLQVVLPLRDVLEIWSVKVRNVCGSTRTLRCYLASAGSAAAASGAGRLRCGSQPRAIKSS